MKSRLEKALPGLAQALKDLARLPRMGTKGHWARK